MRSAIVGISGATLTETEARLLRRLPPAGVILFARNIEDPGQLARLVAGLRWTLAPGAVLMVDQEGGRVARLCPPFWRAHPPAAAIGAAFRRNARAGLRASRLSGALIGLETRAAGFDVVTAPVLDLGLPGKHRVIGDRAFDAEPRVVGQLGGAFAAGLLAAEVAPVMKHIPGHGRAEADSHEALPRVVESRLDDDLAPFRANVHLPWAMTAHILYTAWDAARPATLSPAIIQTVIRERVGFEGVLVTDDLAMGALNGCVEDRARAAIAAGCDLALYCAGEADANEVVLAAVPELGEATRKRLAAARRMRAAYRIPLDARALAAERDRLLAS